MRGGRERGLAGIIGAALIGGAGVIGTSGDSYARMAAEEQKREPISVNDPSAITPSTYLSGIIYGGSLAELSRGKPNASGDTLIWKGDELSVSRTGCAPTAPVTYAITHAVEGSMLEARITAIPNVHYDPSADRISLEKRYSHIKNEDERERVVVEHLTQIFYQANITVRPVKVGNEAEGILSLTINGSKPGEYNLTTKVTDNSKDARIKEFSTTVKAQQPDIENLQAFYLQLERMFKH